MSSLIFLTFSLIFTYSCLSQEGFSGGWTVSLRVDEFSCMFEIIIACPSIQYYFWFFLDSSRLQEYLLPLPCWCSLPPFLSSCPVYYWVSVEHSDPSLHLFSSFSFLPALHFSFFCALTCCFAPLPCCVSTGAYTVHRIVQTASFLPPHISLLPSQQIHPSSPPSIAQELFPALAISCHGLI